jgi:hypothetical protein
VNLGAEQGYGLLHETVPFMTHALIAGDETGHLVLAFRTRRHQPCLYNERSHHWNFGPSSLALASVRCLVPLFLGCFRYNNLLSTFK